VPIFDPFRVRFADAGWPEMPEPVDGPVPVDWTGPVPWSDPTPWAGTDIETTVQIGAIKGAELIVLDTNAMGDALGTGHFISINDYLYLTTRTHTLQGSGGDYYRPFDIGPPLREAIQPGDVVKIGRPTILCRLAEDRSGTIRLKFGRYGQPSMEFIEVLQREAPER